MYCFYWVEEKRLAGSCAPMTIPDILFIKGQGVRRVVVLPESEELAYIWGYPERYFELLTSYGLKHLHTPVRDFSAPTLGQLRSIFKWIKEDDSPVLIHCVGGLGRTGTVVAAWLILEKGYSLRDAVARVRSLRPGSIESYEQARFLEKLEQIATSTRRYKKS